MPNCKSTKKTLSHILRHAFWLHFLRIHHFLRIQHDYFFQRGFESVRAEFLFRKYIRKVVLFKKVYYQKGGGVLSKRCSQRPWHGCFPANFAKFLRTPFLTEDLRGLLLLFLIYLFNYDSSKITFVMLNMAFDVLLSTVFIK